MKFQALVLLILFLQCVNGDDDNVFADLDELAKSEDIFNDIVKSLDELNELTDRKRKDETKKEAETINVITDEEEETEQEDNVGESVLEQISSVNNENDLLDGDDIMPDPSSQNDYGKRNALRDNSKLWFLRDIPYVLDSSLTDQKKTVIKSSMADMSSKTCIKFHEKTASDTGNYINIKNSSGCWSYVGKIQGPKQDLSIGDGCQYKGIIQHELLHALGFFHEQSRYDRDTYVEIKWENIKAGREGNFKIQSKLATRNTGTGYDYASIMHYGMYAFTKNRKPTIVALGNSKQQLGQRYAMSQTDIDSLNRLYHCDKNKKVLAPDEWTQWSDYGGCHIFQPQVALNCEKRRYRFCGNYGNCACDKDSSGKQVCNEQSEACPASSCRLDGHWSIWGSWSACSVSAECKKGTKTRSRTCTNPKPAYGGVDCVGNSTDVGVCEVHCSHECLFDDGNNCGYTTTGGWKRISGGTPSVNTGPSTDVSGQGSYLFTETSGSGVGFPYKTSLLKSPIFLSSGSTQCFSMYYHMYGASIGSLTVSVYNNNSTTQMWRKENNQGNLWREMNFNIEFNNSSPNPFQVQIKAVSGSSWQGDIAVDNLVLNKTPCVGWSAWGSWSPCSPLDLCATRTKTRNRTCNPPGSNACAGNAVEVMPCAFLGCPGKCTFDNGKVCSGYTYSGGWTLRKGSTPSSNTGPSTDVSGGGYYMYTETSYIGVGFPNKTSLLKSPIFLSSGSTQCFSMYYHMYGASIGSLTVSVYSNNSTTQMWRKENNQGNVWSRMELNIDSSNPFQIHIKAVSGSSWQGDIAVDDLFLNTIACGGTLPTATTPSPVSSSTPSPVSSSTSSPVSSSTSSPVSSSTPSPVSSSTPSPVSSSTPSPVSSSTPSPVSSSTPSPVSSSTPSPVSSSTPSPVSSSTPSPVSSSTPSPVSSSTPSPVSSSTPSPVSSSTPSPVSSSTPSPVSSSTPSPVSSSTPSPVSSSTSAPSTTKQPIPANSILKFNISFDRGMGGMVNKAPFPGAALSKAQWKLRAHVKANKTGITDRVFEGGSFLAVTAENDRDSGRSSVVASRTMVGNGAQRIEFYYNMWSGSLPLGVFAKMGVLKVDIVAEGSLPQTIFMTFDGHNGAWQYARAKVDVLAGKKFHLVFKATLGRAPMMIAIDDLQGLPLPAISHSNKLFSPSGLACSFSNPANSSCYWRLAGDFKWRPQRGETPSKDTGPDAPGAVTGNGKDSYFYAEATGRKSGDVAVMHSPLIFTKRPMCMYLYSSTHGDGRLTGALISLTNAGKKVKIERNLTADTYSGKWRFNSMQLPTNHIFKIVLNATVGTSVRSDVAVDNIFVAPGKCVKNFPIHISICDFADMKNCKGLSGNGFNVVIDKSDGFTKPMKIYRAELKTGNATLGITLPVDQRGACLNFQYRITPVDSTKQAFVDYCVSSSGRIYVKKVLKPEAEGGYKWKYFQKTIPPRPKQERMTVAFHGHFNGGAHDVRRIDIMQISYSPVMCL